MRAREIIVAALCLSLGACAETGQRPSPVVPGADAGLRNVDGAAGGPQAPAPQGTPGIQNPGLQLDPGLPFPHFAYVTQTGQKPDNSPAQQLRLAQITDSSPPAGPAATGFKTLLDTTIPDGSGLNTIYGLWVSPGNQRLLAFVIDSGSDFLDQNLTVWNMGDGKSPGVVNEFDVIAIIHRKTCPSAKFDAYLAQLKMQGMTSQSDLDSLDYSIPINSPADQINLPSLQVLGWLDDTRFALSWTVPFWTTDGMNLTDTFKVIATWPQGGGPATVTCTSLRQRVPLPVPNPPTALSADPTIRLHGIPVKWTQQGQPVPAPQAQYIAGVIWP